MGNNLTTCENAIVIEPYMYLYKEFCFFFVKISWIDFHDWNRMHLLLLSCRSRSIG